MTGEDDTSVRADKQESRDGGDFVCFPDGAGERGRSAILLPGQFLFIRSRAPVSIVFIERDTDELYFFPVGFVDLAQMREAGTAGTAP